MRKTWDFLCEFCSWKSDKLSIEESIDDALEHMKTHEVNNIPEKTT